jgi:hypothetical protein
MLSCYGDITTYVAMKFLCYVTACYHRVQQMRWTVRELCNTRNIFEMFAGLW